jgi:hypothetical protein
MDEILKRPEEEVLAPKDREAVAEGALVLEEIISLDPSSHPGEVEEQHAREDAEEEDRRPAIAGA